MVNQNFVSEKLKNSRISKNLSYDIVSYETKIPKRYLEFLEAGQFGEFETLDQCLNYIEIYAHYLGLNPENYTKIIKRDLGDNSNARKIDKNILYGNELLIKQGKLNKGSYKNKRLVSLISLSRKLLSQVYQWKIGIFLFILAIGLAVFFVNSFYNSTKSPVVLITEPFDLMLIENIDLPTTERQIRFSGRVDGVGELRINNKLISQRVGGFFETDNLPLTQANNRILFSTKNLFGNQLDVVLNLRRTDIIETSETVYPLLVQTSNRAGFLLIKSDGEIVFNDITQPDEQIGIDASAVITLESNNYQNITIIFKDQSYQMNKSQESFLINEEGLVRQ